MMKKEGYPTRVSMLYSLIGSRAESIGTKNLIERKEHIAIASILFETGHSMKLVEDVRQLREKLDLTRKPPTTLTYITALKDLRKIMRITGFHKRFFR